ncbi:unnamed protein product [Ceutorhynchus assimilis]|uniref:BCL2/adenovirus E1B 19 kDa protein-interacting protein 3 n=1 Tax=Ceutorhynchus assimilis TaxID=467358 RepID=A0A9N9QJ05_9CUCU|nr:unnamed protein product [Ceutorhynchus assimilis]
MSSSKNAVVNTTNDDALGESWVEIAGNYAQGGGTPASVTQQLTTEDYLRLLREAQESNQSSCKASLAGSLRDSPRSSPKSPPNSPIIQGSPMNLEWQSYYINSESSELKDFLTDWSSRPDCVPPKSWSFRVPSSANKKHDHKFSLRHAKIGNTSLFSKRGLCIMFLTNLFSLLIGTGVGLFLNRQNMAAPAIKVR